MSDSKSSKADGLRAMREGRFAVKSGGGSRGQPFDPADAAGVKSGTVTIDGQTGRPNRVKVGAKKIPGSSVSSGLAKPITQGQASLPPEPIRPFRKPLAKDAHKTLAANKPWEAEGLSRRTWFRRQAAKKETNK